MPMADTVTWYSRGRQRVSIPVRHDPIDLNFTDQAAEDLLEIGSSFRSLDVRRILGGFFPEGGTFAVRSMPQGNSGCLVLHCTGADGAFVLKIGPLEAIEREIIGYQLIREMADYGIYGDLDPAVVVLANGMAGIRMKMVGNNPRNLLDVFPEKRDQIARTFAALGPMYMRTTARTRSLMHLPSILLKSAAQMRELRPEGTEHRLIADGIVPEIERLMNHPAFTRPRTIRESLILGDTHPKNWVEGIFGNFVIIDYAGVCRGTWLRDFVKYERALRYLVWGRFGTESDFDELWNVERLLNETFLPTVSEIRSVAWKRDSSIARDLGETVRGIREVAASIMLPGEEEIYRLKLLFIDATYVLSTRVTCPDVRVYASKMFRLTASRIAGIPVAAVG